MPQVFLISALCLLFVSCATTERTVTKTQPVSLSHAKGGITDAKDFLSKARKSNDEMGAIIRQLMEEHK